MVTIRRETWKGRHVYTARDDFGRLLSWQRSKGSGLTRRIAVIRFRNQQSLRKSVFKMRLTKVREVTVYQEKVRRRGRKLQAVTQILNRRGKVLIAARSDSSFTKSSARLKQEADERAYALLADSMGYDYDEDIGETLIRENRYRLRHGVVYYETI